MDVKFEITEDILIAVLSGELDHHSAASLRQTVDEAMELFQVKHLIFDFAGVGFMDSAGIGVVMGRYNRAKERGGSVTLVGCTEYVDRILEMAGVYTIAKRGESINAALMALRGSIPVVDSLEGRMEIGGTPDGEVK